MKRLIPLASAVMLLAWVPAQAAPDSAQKDFSERRAVATAAIARISKQSAQTPRVVWAADRSRPAMLRGLRLKLAGKNLEQKSRKFITNNAELVVGTSADFQLIDERSTHDRKALRFQQTYKGLVVEGKTITTSFDAEGRLRAFHGNVADIGSIETKAKLQATKAIQVARDTVGHGAKVVTKNAKGKAVTTLVILPHSPALLAYRITLPIEADPLGRIHYVDAQSGEYRGVRPGVRWESRGKGGQR
jgi:Zn-dependent metalloprotease